jgi:hypothetical protein
MIQQKEQWAILERQDKLGLLSGIIIFVIFAPQARVENVSKIPLVANCHHLRCNLEKTKYN